MPYTAMPFQKEVLVERKQEYFYLTQGGELEEHAIVVHISNIWALIRSLQHIAENERVSPTEWDVEPKTE